MRDGPEIEGPSMPDPARGARPAGGGVAAALLSGALGTSRIPRTAVSRIRGAGRHPPNGCPAGAGPVIGANRARPARRFQNHAGLRGQAGSPRAWRNR